MPAPKPCQTSGLRRIDEPHPVATEAQRHQPAADAESASKLAGQLQDSVTITHRIPRGLRDRLKIAAVRLARREQDIVAAALREWLDRHHG